MVRCSYGIPIIILLTAIVAAENQAGGTQSFTDLSTAKAVSADLAEGIDSDLLCMLQHSKSAAAWPRQSSARKTRIDEMKFPDLPSFEMELGGKPSDSEAPALLLGGAVGPLRDENSETAIPVLEEGSQMEQKLAMLAHIDSPPLPVELGQSFEKEQKPEILASGKHGTAPTPLPTSLHSSEAERAAKTKSTQPVEDAERIDTVGSSQRDLQPAALTQRGPDPVEFHLFASPQKAQQHAETRGEDAKTLFGLRSFESPEEVDQKPTLTTVATRVVDGAHSIPGQLAEVETVSAENLSGNPVHFYNEPSEEKEKLLALQGSSATSAELQLLDTKGIQEAVGNIDGALSDANSKAAQLLRTSALALKEDARQKRSLDMENKKLRAELQRNYWKNARLEQYQKALARQDAEIRKEDVKLRESAESLKSENSELQKALTMLSEGAYDPTHVNSSLKLADMPSDGMNQGDQASLANSLQNVFLSFITAVQVAVEPNVTVESKNATSATNVTPAAVKSLANARGEGGGASHAHATKIGLILLGVGFVAWILIEVGEAMQDKKGSKIHSHHRSSFTKYLSNSVCCGMSASGIWGLAIILVTASLSFAVLWYMGVIQPIMKEMVCWVYLGVVLLAVIAVALAEAWRSFEDMFAEQMEAMTKLQSFFSAGRK